MKPIHTLLGAALLLATSFARAQNYSITWYTVDGGGGISTGGVYSVAGTIGQPDTGLMTGGNFTLAGGYWGEITVQTTGLPYLWAWKTSTNTVCIWWQLPDGDCRLQSATNLIASPVAWADVPTPYQTNGTTVYFLDPLPAGKSFYRLHRP